MEIKTGPINEPRPDVTALVTIVMYHYVRSVEATRFPHLPALDLAAFDGQLDYITRYYSPVSTDHVLAAASGGATLPRRPIVLTFDDGYAEHYRQVFPRLRERRVPAVFFPVTSALLGRRVLDVNKIQFVLAASVTPDPIVGAIEDAIERHAGRADVRTAAEYRAHGWTPVRYDTAAVSYVKYMLQQALPEDVRSGLVDALFTRLVSTDEAAFADELYFTTDQAREMAGDGMTIGCHADRHTTLTSLTPEGQAREIDGAMRVLDAIGLPRTPFVYCYAKGAYDAHSIELLRARGCVMAVTNRAELATLAADTMLALPRIDANHLPADGLAPPNEWTLSA